MKVVEGEVEGMGVSEEKVVRVMEEYEKEIERRNMDMKERRRGMEVVKKRLGSVKR